MIVCPQCRQESSVDSQFCVHCGARLVPTEAEEQAPNRSPEASVPADNPQISNAGQGDSISGSHDSLIGRVLDGRYQLVARIGEGGMGAVYRATHLLIDRPVAVKVLNHRFVTDEAARERFRREARAAGRLRHTNAVAVTDFGQTADDTVYIVMELLEGRSLRELLALESPLDAARAASIM